MSDRDPRIDPQPGDFLPNQGRTVLRRFEDSVLFGMQRGDSKNCGAYRCSLADWQEWAAGSWTDTDT